MCMQVDVTEMFQGASVFYLLVCLHRHPLAHRDPPLSEDTGDWPRQPVQITDFLRDHSGAAPVAALVSVPAAQVLSALPALCSCSADMGQVSEAQQPPREL